MSNDRFKKQSRVHVYEKSTAQSAQSGSAHQATHSITQRRPAEPLETQQTISEASHHLPDQIPLPAIGVFEDLSQQILDRLLLIGQRIRYDSGDQVNEVGDPCQGLSFVIMGSVQVDLMDALGWVTIAHLQSGDIFGAMEWLEKKIWEERLLAVETTEVLFLPTRTLKPLNARYPELQRQVERHTQRHTLQGLLGHNELFQKINPQEILKLIDVATIKYIKGTTWLFDHTLRKSVLFVIGRGEVNLVKDGHLVQTLGRGDIINIELALGDDIHELSAYSVTQVVLYSIPFEDVEIAFAQANQLHQLQYLAHQRRARALGEY